VAVLVLFAGAREAAGTGRDELPGETVADVLDHASQRYGSEFAEVLTRCRVWVNGEEALPTSAVGADDEVAVLPPVSGG
jgi:molybdopterin converting factor small subunit